jgi:hypothetical protein
MTDNIPENVLNPLLYKKARIIADKTYKRHSAYKSMFLVKTYQELGGKYSSSTSGLERWRKQQWVSMEHYLNGNFIECGSDSIGKNVCRPLYKVGQEDILTASEVLRLHGKRAIRNIIKEKKRNMDLILDWKTLTLK